MSGTYDMRYRRIACLLVCLGGLLCMSCSSGRLESAPLTITRADGSSVTVQAELARTAEERQHGFMERRKIPDGTGMLFIFSKDEILHFWMKNTYVPLSIAYIDSSGRIRDIFDMTPLSLASVSSTVSVRYALEVPQGWFERNGIQKGDRISGF